MGCLGHMNDGLAFQPTWFCHTLNLVLCKLGFEVNTFYSLHSHNIVLIS